jgi:hypothetical protein
LLLHISLLLSFGNTYGVTLFGDFNDFVWKEQMKIAVEVGDGVMAMFGMVSSETGMRLWANDSSLR